MTRGRSKYEQALRERAGRFDVSDVTPDADDSVTIEVDGVVSELAQLEGSAPVAASAPQAVLDAVAKAVQLDPSAIAAEDPSVHVGHTAEDCPYPAPRERVITATFTSSNVVGAELDTTTGIVAVSFRNGQTYRYGNFTADLMAAWKTAPSAGSWFHNNVRQRAAAHPLVTA